MLNLLKADLLRIVKDKLYIVLACILGGLGIIIPIAMFGFMYLVSGDTLAIREGFSSLGLSTMMLAPFSNVGLVLAIFMIIIITKDFTNGTVRNKLIMGKTRTEVFFSNVLSSMIVIMGTIIGFVLITFSISCIFFNSGFGASNTGSLLANFGLALLGWVALVFAINFFAMVMKNAGVAIVIYVIIGLVFTFGSSISSTVSMLLQSEDAARVSMGEAAKYTTAINVLDTLDSLNFVGAMTSKLSNVYSIFADMGSTELTGAFYAEYCASACVVGTLFGVGGYFIFKKKDLK